MALRWTCQSLVKIKQPSFAKIFRQRLYSTIQLDPKLKIEEIYTNEDALIDDMESLNIKLSGEYIEEGTDDYIKVGKQMKQIRSGFCEMLKKTGSIIAGSFILDCLYNTNYHNDIDLYVHSHVNSHVCIFDMPQYLKLSGFSTYCFPETDSIIHTISLTGLKTSPLIQIIPMDLTYKRPKRGPNEIQWKNRQLQRKSLKTVLNATYDLDICKSCFDGTGLYIRNWNKLFRRSDYIKCNMQFVMHFYGGEIEEAGVDMDKTNSRMEKYKSRGFDIKLHPQNADIITYVTNIINLPDVRTGVQAVDDDLLNLDLFYLE